MIQLTINSTSVFFCKPFKGLPEDILAAVMAAAPRRVVFIDTPPMQGLMTAIRQVTEALPTVEVILRDHHDIPDPRTDRDRDIHVSAEEVRNLLGDKAVISDRRSNPACSSLVELGEFGDSGTVIIADVDPDGLTAAMKATGVTYDSMDSDAAILDGPRTQQNAEGGLSPLAVLLAKGMATLPPFNPGNPAPSERAKQALFADFVSAAQSDAKARTRLEERVAIYEEAVTEATRLSGTAEEVASGVFLVNTAGEPRFDLGTLTSSLEARQGCRVTVVRKDSGPIAAAHKGVQYSLARAKSAGEELDLRSYLPEGFVSDPACGIICNTPFLLHVSEDVWQREVLPRLRGER